MSDVSDDEYTVLLIMDRGEALAAIGRWEKPLDALVTRGLVRRLDKFNNIITTEGKKALGAREQADDTALRQLAPQVNAAQAQARSHVEAAAQHLCRAAQASAPMTGDDPITALMTWNIECLRRAREMLRQ